MRDVVIKTTTASLYAAPTIRSARTDEALCGMAARVLSENGPWARVRMAYGYEGYLKQSDLCAAPSADASAGLRRVVRAVAADVLAAPDVKAPLVRTMTTGCILTLAAEDAAESEAVRRDPWRRVVLPDGRTGFIRAAFLKPEAALLPAPCLMAPTAADALRRRVLRTALMYRGTQYRWGGKSPWGIDCSGLCFMAYWLNGITIYRDARIEPDYPVAAIPLDAARVGDLLFFPGHVGMFWGDGRMVHASEADNGVRVVPLTPERMKKLLTAGSVFDILHR